MLREFLAACSCVLPEESEDFQDALRLLSCLPVRVGLLPAIEDDLYPVCAFSCTSAKRISSPNVWLVPVGAHDGWGLSGFERIVDKFYREDAFREQYGIGLEEMILLNCPDVKGSFTLEGGARCNVVFCRLTVPGGAPVILLIVPEAPDGCWDRIVEPFGIPCEILIDSHRGLGDWLDAVPLFRRMRETERTDLLPRLYFKGRYNKWAPPAGFRRIFTIPEPIEDGERRIRDWEKELYEIDWEAIRTLS